MLQRCIRWREANIKEKQFILILSFLVGIFTAIAALFLKFLIHQIQNFLTDNFNATSANYLYLVYPVIGIFLAGWFVRNIVKDDISHGVTKILYAISRRQGRIKRHNIWSSTIASAITIGFGGSVGAEAPIVLTGSAIGSNLGSVFKMEHRTLMLLVGCGAAGAIAGIFKAPIAGLVFTLEVLMIDLTMSSLLPLLISAVTDRSHVQSQPRPGFRTGTYPLCDSAGYFLRIDFSLFHTGNELYRRGIRETQEPLPEASFWWCDAKCTDLPFPSALWRRL